MRNIFITLVMGYASNLVFASDASDYVADLEPLLLDQVAPRASAPHSGPAIPAPRRKPTPQSVSAAAARRSKNSVSDDLRDLLARSSDLGRLASDATPARKAEVADVLQAQLPARVKDDFAKLRAISTNNLLELRFDASRKLSGFKGDFSLSSQGDITQRLIDVMESHPSIFAIEADTQLTLAPSCSAKACSYRVERKIRNLPVWGGDFSLTVVDDRLISARGLFDGGEIIFGDPARWGRDEILDAVADYFGKTKDEITLGPIFEEGIRVLRPMWFHAIRVTVEVGALESYHVFFAVDTGRITDVLSLVFSAYEDSEGHDLLGQLQSFRSERINGINRLADDQAPPGAISTVSDLQGSDFLEFFSATYATAVSASGPWDPTAVSAIANARKTTDYFLEQHGRNGLDGSGGGSISFIDATFDGSANNAMNSGSLIWYGKGDNVVFSDTAAALDVAAHEFTHGVISSSSKLEYKFQSGALNESFADIFGVMLDPEDWLLGEDMTVADPGFLRSMSSPSSGLSPQPENMSEYRNLPESTDKGGVHINSGIPNRAFYLLAEGLTTEGLGSGVGRSKAAQIAYQTMVSLPSTATFDQAADAMHEQAGILYGAVEQQAVSAAFEAVGLSIDSVAPEPPALPTPGTSNLAVAIYPSGENYLLLGQLFDNDFAGFNAQLFFQFNTQSANLKRPSLATDSSGNGLATYFNAANDLIGANIQTGENAVLVASSTFRTVAYAPALTKIAATATSGNVIAVCDLKTSECDEYSVFTPDYSSDASGGIPAKIVDALDWDATGRSVAFDYATCSSEVNGQCEDYQWAIGILNTITGSFSYPLAAQPERFNVGYPSFANLTDRYVVFDLLESNASHSNGIGSSLSLILDRDESRLLAGAAADNGLVSGPNGPRWGVPTFTADDSGLVFTRYDANDSPRLHLADLSEYVNTNVAVAGPLDPYVSYLPVSAPYLHRPPALDLVASRDAIDFGILENGSTNSEEVCVTNSGSARITVAPATVSDDFVDTSLTGAVLTGGQKMCGKISIDTSGLVAGSTFDAVVSVPSDASILGISVGGSVAPSELVDAPSVTRSDYGDGELYLYVTANFDGAATITGYTATCTDGTNTFTGTSTSSPITVSGLTNEVSYTCTVTATNSVGTSPASAVTDPITPEASSTGLPTWLLYQATQ